MSLGFTKTAVDSAAQRVLITTVAPMVIPHAKWQRRKATGNIVSITCYEARSSSHDSKGMSAPQICIEHVL
jgi:hypothetical protein